MSDHKTTGLREYRTLASVVGGSTSPKGDDDGSPEAQILIRRHSRSGRQRALATASRLRSRSIFRSRGGSSPEGGFTLAELIVSVGALALITVLATQLLNSATTIMTIGHRQMNADAEARELFDRMAVDFSQMIKRSDIDYYLKSSTTASDCTLCTRQRGNDQIAFYSTVPGWSSLTGPQQSPVSIVGYRIHVSPDTFSNRLERLAEGLVWNGATGDTRSDGHPASIVFGAPLNPWANTSHTPFDIISSGVFRFEYYYLLKNGDLSSTPWYTISSVRGMQDVSAVIVDIAVLDQKTRVLLTDSDIAAIADALPDFGGQAPGVLLASWRTTLDANRTVPRSALAGVRLYERWFHISPPSL